MNIVDSLKKVIKDLTYVALGVASLVVVVFIIHVINVGKYNAEWRVATPDSTATQVMVDIHPRGGVTDSWVKNNSGLGVNLNAKIYEMVINNNTHGS